MCNGWLYALQRNYTPVSGTPKLLIGAFILEPTVFDKFYPSPLAHARHSRDRAREIAMHALWLVTLRALYCYKSSCYPTALATAIKAPVINCTSSFLLV